MRNAVCCDLLLIIFLLLFIAGMIIEGPRILQKAKKGV